MSRPLLLGHRGARRYAPENTLKAFDLCLRHGCDGFEFDLRCTRDGRAVVCHDAKVFGHEIAATDFEQLKASMAGFDQVLEKFADAFLDIEIKAAGFEKQVLDAVARSSAHSYVISSFLPEVVNKLAELDSAVPLGWICDEPGKAQRWRELPGEYFIPHHMLVDATRVEAVHAAGKKLLVWTVNDAAAMRAFAGMGVDGIISDDTQLLGSLLGGDGR